MQKGHAQCDSRQAAAGAKADVNDCLLQPVYVVQQQHVRQLVGLHPARLQPEVLSSTISDVTQ